MDKARDNTDNHHEKMVSTSLGGSDIPHFMFDTETFNATHATLTGFFIGKVNNREDVEDLISEVYIRRLKY